MVVPQCYALLERKACTVIDHPRHLVMQAATQLKHMHSIYAEQTRQTVRIECGRRIRLSITLLRRSIDDKSAYSVQRHGKLGGTLLRVSNVTPQFSMTTNANANFQWPSM